MSTDSKYNDYIVESILYKNDFGIIQVTNLKSLKVLYFDFADYPRIENYIIENKVDLVTDSIMKTSFREYLNILKFMDQNANEYIVSVYDSDELWQNPEVIKIYPQTNAS